MNENTDNKSLLTNNFICGKYVIRKTKEEVEIIAWNQPNYGDRDINDWVTYIDSKGEEHIKEHLNIQLDFKPVVNDTFNKVFDFATNKMPTTKNTRIYEVAKELVVNSQYHIEKAIKVATELVDNIGIETN